MRFLVATGMCIACVLIGPSASSQAAGSDVRALLRDVAGFTDADWSTIEHGGAVAKILDTDTREIAVAGAVRIAAAPERLVARIREIDNLKRSAIVLDVGRFSSPPRPADLASVPFEEYNLDLRECRPGECRVRLAAPDIARFHREVQWGAGGWRERSAAVWREVLAEYASTYARDGRKALPTFANKQDALSVGDELSLLAGKFGFVSRFSTDLHAYLQEFGPVGPPRTEDVLYWTKEDFGVRPVFRISHQVIAPGSGAAASVVATNQVYADHYLDAALGVTLAIPSSTAEGQQGFYMVAVNRARTRSLSSWFRRIVRGTVQGRSRDAMRKILIATKTALESSSHRQDNVARMLPADKNAARRARR
jgi:hypothetical protein